MARTKSTYGDRKMAIASMLLGTGMKYDVPYCFPSQETILRNCLKYHNNPFSRRTLNRDLKRMEAEGFFKRVRRLTRKGINVGRFMSTLYLLKRELFKLTARLAKWGQKVSSAFRVPRLAHNKSLRDNEILKEVATDVEKLWKSPSEGGPNPMEHRRVGHQGHL